MDRGIENSNITRVRPLITPAVLAEQVEASDATFALVRRSRRALEAILDDSDPRLIVVVGPCSIHDTSAALDYARRLKAVAPKYENLLILMRVYFEKPRTVVGWKGLINDPDIDGSYNINKGLHMARRLLVDLAEIGLPCATEFLDTTFGQYYADLISWGAIGARTAESQIHRELASGLSMPVGIKNRTDGDLKVAVDAIRSAAHKHLFPSLTKEGAPAIFETAGNPYCHLILRGGDRTGPNYHDKDIQAAANLLCESGLKPNLVIDCSHGNSQKNHDNQSRVIDSVCQSLTSGEQRIIKGLMIESFIEAGNQPYNPDALIYGKSITDACVSWSQTLPLLKRLNAAAGAA